MLHRIATTAIAAAVALPFAAAPVAAETAEPAVEQSNWFWREQVGGTIDPIGVPYPGQLPEHTVPKGDLAVAVDPRQASDPKQDPDKETYLAWGLYDIPTKSSLSSFKVTMPLDQEAKGNVFAEPPKLIACLPKQAWSGGDGAEQFAGKPKDDCSSAAAGTFDDKKKAYTFDLTSFAQTWVDGDTNNGVAIRHALDYAKPFQVVFLPADKVKAEMAYVPATTAPTTQPTVPAASGGGAPAVPADPSLDAGSGGSIPGVDTGTLAGGEVDVPTSTGAAGGPQPVTASQPTQTVPRALSFDTGPTPAFWLAVLGGVILLGLASLTLGDAAVPLAATQSRGGLTRALDKRRRAAATTAVNGAEAGLAAANGAKSPITGTFTPATADPTSVTAPLTLRPGG